jgi:ATP-binding cassette subfamily B protein
MSTAASPSCTAQNKDAGLVSRYTNQPAQMPAGLRNRIEADWGDQPVQLYALADLNDRLELDHTWVALGPEHVALAIESNGKPESIRSFERARVKSVRETPGLSCTVMTILGETNEPALAILRYTHRQRRAMENVKFVLQEAIAGNAVEPSDPDRLYAESVARAVKDAQASVAGRRATVIWRLLSYLRPYRARLAFGFVAATVMTLLMLVPPRLTGYFIDNIVRPFEGGTLTRTQGLRMAGAVVAAIAVLLVLRELGLWVRLRTLAILGENVARDLRRDLYGHIQKLSVSFFSKMKTGSIITRVSSDTDRLWDFIAFGLVETGQAVLMLLGLSIVLIASDWQLGLVLILPLPLVLWALVGNTRRMRIIFLRCWRKWSALTEVLADTIPGMRVVKAFNREEQEKRRFNTRNEDATDFFNTVHTVWTRFWPMLMLGLNVLTLVVWAIAVTRLLPRAGTQPSLTAGKFVAFLLYMGMFLGPIEMIGMMTRMISRVTSAAHRVFEVLDTNPEVVDVPEPVRLEPVEGRVTFENVTFGYDGVRQVLKGVSFDVEPGEMIGLVGPSGAGKTTITNLLVRFYDVVGGRILVDGVDIRQLDSGHFRRQIGMVLQDPHLFCGTILDNIRYGFPEASVEQVIEAARAANAHDFICALPHGYDTLVGERGHTLSGGERQRVSIARAILNNPRILILDEATSSVDTETERKIQEALERVVQGRTVFAIAHRLSTLRRATRLFVIEEGRITEKGSHAELLAKEDGTYAKLYRLQHELHEMFAL